MVGWRLRCHVITSTELLPALDAGCLLFLATCFTAGGPGKSLLASDRELPDVPFQIGGYVVECCLLPGHHLEFAVLEGSRSLLGGGRGMLDAVAVGKSVACAEQSKRVVCNRRRR